MNVCAQKKSNLIAFIFGVALCAFILLGAEITVRLFWKEVFPASVIYSNDHQFIDPYGIAKANPSGQYQSMSQINKTGATIYDVTYSIDSYSRRITPVSNPELRDKHLLFFGCSYTYGEGVRDDQTIPARVAFRTRQYMPYNYAFHGHGPAEMLAKMESKTLNHEVKEKEGILIYIFMDQQIKRVICSMRIVTSWAKNKPYYYLGPHDEVFRKGNLTTGRPILRQIYRLLAKSELLKFFKIDFPPVITNRHIHITARVIEESRRLYREQFPNGDFYVVIYPSSRYGTRLAKELSRSGIKILDESKIFSAHEPRYILSMDNKHPSALADDELAQHLVQDLHF